MKKVLYVLLGIVVLYLILALIGPKKVEVERSIEIGKPASVYKDKLADYQFFNAKWNPWAELDSNMKAEFTGTPGTPGHTYKWEGNDKVREGEMEIKEVKADTVIQNIYFGKGRKMGVSRSWLAVSGNDQTSKMTWHLTLGVGFFFRPVMMFMSMDKMIGERFEVGLKKLKTEVESMNSAVSGNYLIEEIQWPEMAFICTSHTTIPFAKATEFFGANFPTMFQAISKKNIKSEMAPCAAYYNWDTKNMTMECAAMVQVPKETEIKGWQKCEIPPSRIIKSVYMGDYKYTEKAHEAMQAFMKDRNFNFAYCLEEYVTDPMSEKDPARWQTNIYYVLR
jgi:effector-binding domain-containing protein